MFKKLMMTVIAATIALTSCTAQTQLLKDLPTGDGVTKVVLGPSMMKIAGSYASGSMGEFGDAFEDVKSIEVYSCDNAKKAKDAQLYFFNALERMKNIELTVTSEEEGEISNIYTILNKAGEPTGMIVYSSDIEAGELSIVIMTGIMKLDTSK